MSRALLATVVLVTLWVPAALAGRVDPGEITLASTNDHGVKGNGNSQLPEISPDGTKVAFRTTATNFDDRDQDSFVDIYVKDLVSGDVTLVTVTADGVKANADSEFLSLSDDATKVAFETAATNLDPRDRDDFWDIYVKDFASGELDLVSTSRDGVKSNGNSFVPSLSHDGTKVAFASYASNFVPTDTDHLTDIYVKDLISGEITLASTSDDDVKGNGASDQADLSWDGTRVAFISSATNLDRRDRDDVFDVYVKNLITGDIGVASTSSTGVKGNANSEDPALSASGRVVGFQTFATNLDPTDSDANWDVYVKDLDTAALVLASTSSEGAKGNDDSWFHDISANGRRVAFVSQANNLSPRDSDQLEDAYVKDLRNGRLYLATTSDTGRKGKRGVDTAELSADGKEVVFDTKSNLDLLLDRDDLYDVYVKQVG